MNCKPFALILVLAVPASAQAIVYDRNTSKVHLEALEELHLCAKRDRSGDFSRAALYEWVDKHPEDAFDAAKLARKTLGEIPALPLFARAFRDKLGDCKDPDVALALGAAAKKPLSKAHQKDFETLAFRTCFEAARTGLEKAASETTGRKNVCKGLLEKDALRGVKKKKCERFVTENPSRPSPK